MDRDDTGSPSAESFAPRFVVFARRNAYTTVWTRDPRTKRENEAVFWLGSYPRRRRGRPFCSAPQETGFDAKASASLSPALSRVAISIPTRNGPGPDIFPHVARTQAAATGPSRGPCREDDTVVTIRRPTLEEKENA